MLKCSLKCILRCIKQKVCEDVDKAQKICLAPQKLRKQKQYAFILSPTPANQGQEVEVASKETGFEGSYYEATIIREVEGNKYVVEYKNLVKDDMSGPLLEIVAGDEVRPVPPEIPATEFRWGDEVDAFDNDGWWVGKINEKTWNYYLVYFEASSKDVFAYPISRLRVHQDWVRGQWISSN